MFTVSIHSAVLLSHHDSLLQELRLTNQELRKQLEDRQDEASL